METTAPRRYAWLFYCLLAIGMWGLWGIVAKAAETEVKPVPMQVISTAGVLVVWVLLLSPNVRKVAPGGERRRHLLLGGAFAFGTGLCGGIGNLAMLKSFNEGAEASAVLPLTGMFPLVTVLLAIVILRERLNVIQAIGMVVALVAIYLFNRSAGGAPTASSGWEAWVSRWVAYALVALVLWGIAGVLQKLATNHISSELSTVLFAAAFVPVAVFLMLTDQMTWTLSGKGWALVLLYGALIGFGTLVLFAAYRDGKASVVTALYALYPALTVLLAIPIFDERMSYQKAAAIGLALAAGVALSYEGQPARAAEPVGVGAESNEVVAR